MGLLARWFKGGLTLPAQLLMTWSEVLFWYRIYELQAKEEEIIGRYQGGGQSVPSPESLRKMVLKELGRDK
jgi:hypothetical protein